MVWKRCGAANQRTTNSAINTTPQVATSRAWDFTKPQIEVLLWILIKRYKKIRDGTEKPSHPALALVNTNAQTMNENIKYMITKITIRRKIEGFFPFGEKHQRKQERLYTFCFRIKRSA